VISEGKKLKIIDKETQL